MAYFVKQNNNVFSHNGVIFKAGELTEGIKTTFKTHSWVSAGANPYRLISCDENRLYFANQSTKEIEIYNLSNLSLITTFSTKNSAIPSSVAGSSLTGLIYVLSLSKLQTYDYDTFAYVNEYSISGVSLDIDESDDRIAIGNSIRKLSDLSSLGSVSGSGLSRLDKVGGRIFTNKWQTDTGQAAVYIYDYDTFALVETLLGSQVGYTGIRMGDIAFANGWVFFQSGNVTYAPYNNPSAGIISNLGITGAYIQGLAFDKVYNRLFAAAYGNATSMIVTQYLFK